MRKREPRTFYFPLPTSNLLLSSAFKLPTSRCVASGLPSMVSVSFLELALCVGTAALADQLETRFIVQQRVEIRRDVVLAVEGSADRPHLAVSERGCIAFAGDRFVSGLL